MSSTSIPLKNSETHVARSFIYRKNLQIFTLISVLAIFCILLNSQFLQSFPSLNIYSKTDIMNISTHLRWSKWSTFNFINKFNISSEISLYPTTPSTSDLPSNRNLKNILKCYDKKLQMSMLQHGNYWLLQNYIRGRKSVHMGCADSITYTTHGDYTFMVNLPKLVERWLAPISLALYAPDDDYNITMSSIKYALHCLPESKLIRDYVTFHIYILQEHLPSFVARNETEISQWPYHCNLKTPPYVKVNSSQTYRSLRNLTLPINIGRNIARKAVNTHFIISSDQILYPSKDLINQFLEMLEKNPKYILESEKPKVFAMPVFELTTNTSIPHTKEELLQMLNTTKAKPFHVNVCPNCHQIPQQKEWLKANNSESLEIFTIFDSHHDSLASWSPLFISNNKEPIFDERIIWEGKSHKRVQKYVMCLLDYEYHVLHPAFLIHAPDLKSLEVKSEDIEIRNNYTTAMNMIIYEEIVPEYKILYGEDKRCVI